MRQSAFRVGKAFRHDERALLAASGVATWLECSACPPGRIEDFFELQRVFLRENLRTEAPA